MRKTSVKPHILSWLQKDPAAGIKPYVFQRELMAETAAPVSANKQSLIISRSCLGASTAGSLLFDHGGLGSPSRLKSTVRTVAKLVLEIAFAPVRFVVMALAAGAGFLAGRP